MPNYQNPKLLLVATTNDSQATGNVAWRCPSNIALVKYWGKYGQQLPRNPSISFTLSQAATDMHIAYHRLAAPSPSPVSIQFAFEGQPNEAFKAKIEKFLQSLIPIFPFLPQLHLSIQSSNTFPHSSGIASSASSMGALALCLCSIEQNLFGTLSHQSDFLAKASYIARLGSGSACRSVYPIMAAWGQSPDVVGSSDEFAVPVAHNIHPIFHTFHNDILIVSSGSKSVSSRAGHQLMEGNPFAPVRYQQANQNLHVLIQALAQGDLNTFGSITETEALTLHALMMTSNPSYILLHPHSLALVERVRQYRTDTQLPLYFSFDAGPNMHLMYPHNIASQVKPFIEQNLLPLCENNYYLPDNVGQGATQLT
jgi:diphosphomevalonate decarboxylase